MSWTCGRIQSQNWAVRSVHGVGDQQVKVLTGPWTAPELSRGWAMQGPGGLILLS